MRSVAASIVLGTALFLPLAACRHAAPPATRSTQPAGLVGAWQAHVRFDSGALAGVDDLKFMYVYNAGGTMTESSNYDGAPPVPPAYGAWKAEGAHRYRTRYAFFVTRPPASFADIAHGGGWVPDGHGVLTETITLSADGTSYTSTISYAVFDASGKPMPGGGKGTGAGVRMGL